MSVRVGIVEDDPLLLSALRKSLQHISGIEVVVATPHSVEFLRALGQQEIDVSLLDVHLGSGPTGFDLARRARTINPRIGLVFLSSVRDPRLLGYNAEGLPPGARYLLKSNVSDISDLATTLLDVAHSALSRPQGAMPRVSLTKSQLEILRLVAEGLNNSEIAKRRVVSERAVEMAVSRLADQLGLKHKPGVNQRVHIATRFFQEMGWTP